MKEETLSRLRKRALCHVQHSSLQDTLIYILHWEHLDALLKRYEDKGDWPMALMEGLAKHMHLRYACIFFYERPTCRLPPHEVISELTDPLKNHVFISSWSFSIVTSFISATWHSLLAIGLYTFVQPLCMQALLPMKYFFLLAVKHLNCTEGV